jgi:hypothetical protein
MPAETVLIQLYDYHAVPAMGLWAHRAAGGRYLGGKTPVGPVYLGYGHARGGQSSLYLFLWLP